MSAIDGPAQTTTVETAVRLNPPVPQPVWPTGIWGLPFAPPGLDECAEADFYRRQFGLPDQFQGIIWRESNCKNYVTSSTGCCRGFLQLNINLHLKDHRVGPRYRDNCGVHSISDAFGHEPLAKQKHMCAAKQLYDVLGTQPWSQTR